MNVQVYHERQTKRPRCYTRSTLTIPNHLVGYYHKRCRDSGSRRALLSFVGNQLAHQQTLFADRLKAAKVKKWKKHYQAEGLGLHRMNFTPFPEDWEAMRSIAIAFGVSICFLFVFLLELEKEGFFERNKLIAGSQSGWNSAAYRSGFEPIKSLAVLKVDAEREIIHRGVVRKKKPPDQTRKT